MVNGVLSQPSTASMPAEQPLGFDRVVKIDSSDRLDIWSCKADGSSRPKGDEGMPKKSASILQRQVLDDVVAIDELHALRACWPRACDVEVEESSPTCISIDPVLEPHPSSADMYPQVGSCGGGQCPAQARGGDRTVNGFDGFFSYVQRSTEPASFDNSYQARNHINPPTPGTAACMPPAVLAALMPR